MPALGFSYALPTFSVTLLSAMLGVLQGIYSTHFGMALTLISAIMFFAGLFDAVTDTAIGYWSDRRFARTGSRRTFVVGGLVLMLPCAWFLFVPAGDAVGGVYFAFWYMTFYLAATLVGIPHVAWGCELTHNPQERTRLFGYRNFGGYAALVLFNALPLLPFFASSAVTPETMRLTVIVAACFLLPAIVVFWRNVPLGIQVRERARQAETPGTALRALTRNRPFLLYLGASLLFGLTIGIFYGLKFILVDSLLGLGEHFVRINLFHLAIATVAIQPAVWLCNHFGKRHTLGLALVLYLVAFLLIAPRILAMNNQTLICLYAIEVFLAVSSACGNVVIPALLSDIIDYDTLKTGRDRSATYFAMLSFFGKIGSTTLGYPLGVGLVGLYGFDPANPVTTERILFGFELAMIWLPSAMAVAALVFTFAMPLNARRRAIVRKRLDQREARLRAVQV